MDNNADNLHKYLDGIANNNNLLTPFLKLMTKQQREKPITLFDGLSIYKQANTPNYSYRINNLEWDLNIRTSCKTDDLEKAKVIALKAWSRYEVMNEFDLIEKSRSETFIDFAERAVIPPLNNDIDGLILEKENCDVPQNIKQIQQRISAKRKRINHVRTQCAFLHNKYLDQLKRKDIEDFAHHVLETQKGGLSWDTFTNYVTVIKKF